MAKLRKVDELDGPPIVGEDYLVPCIKVGRYFQPVFGGAHIDHVRPELEHYHPDRRFLSEEIVSGYSPKGALPFGVYNPCALTWHNKMQGVVIEAGDPPEYQPLTCLRELPEWCGVAPPWLSANDACAKARWKGGNPYCPHQGLQLAQFWDGETEVIRCPLHGLQVDMRRD